MKQLKNHVEDLMFAAGAAALSAGGFFIRLPVGLFILGACLVAGAFIVGGAKRKRGDS